MFWGAFNLLIFKMCYCLGFASVLLRLKTLTFVYLLFIVIGFLMWQRKDV